MGFLEDLKNALARSQGQEFHATNLVVEDGDQPAARGLLRRWFYKERTGKGNTTLYSYGDAGYVVRNGRKVERIVVLKEEAARDIVNDIESHPTTQPSGRHRGRGK